MTTIFTQHDNFFHQGTFLSELCELAQLEINYLIEQSTEKIDTTCRPPYMTQNVGPESN